MPFANLPALPGRAIFPGVTGRYAHEARLTVGEIELAAGATVALHQHPHDQLSYVIGGAVEFAIGPDKKILNAGECALIPGGAAHGCRAITACRLLDVFTPVREDYRA